MRLLTRIRHRAQDLISIFFKHWTKAYRRRLEAEREEEMDRRTAEKNMKHVFFLSQIAAPEKIGTVILGLHMAHEHRAIPLDYPEPGRGSFIFGILQRLMQQRVPPPLLPKVAEMLEWNEFRQNKERTEGFFLLVTIGRNPPEIQALAEATIAVLYRHLDWLRQEFKGPEAAKDKEYWDRLRMEIYDVDTMIKRFARPFW